jgi:CopG family nickel-responsive transcriptional regulator
MKDPLVRFGVAIEGSLLRQLDALVKERGGTRSELLRDLARSEVGRAKVRRGVDAVCSLTLVYDHHVRDLSEKLTELQHQLGDGVRAALHVHLSHDLCLEVIVMRGKSDQLQSIANRILAMRGVKQGGIEIVASLAAAPRAAAVARVSHGHSHAHAHSHAHSLSEDHAHAHLHAPAPASATEGETARSSASARGRGARRAAPAKSGSSGSPPAPPRRARTRRA